MPRIDPEGQITRAERLATVVAIAAAVLVHVVVLLGWGRLARWTQEEEKKERLMVIRRVRDLAPSPEAVPARPRQPRAPGGGVGAAQEAKKPSPPEPKVKEQGPEPPRSEPELSPAMERDLQEQPEPSGDLAGRRDNSVSVVTDLPAASFIVDGPAQYRGSGTFWVRKGAAPGRYTVTFNPVPGYSTPAVQSKELQATGQVVFVGKYRRSTEIVVDSNESGASFTIFRPDGRALDLQRPGRALLDDLPPGVYTAVFKDVPGHVTPPPSSKTLAPGGTLSFFGRYEDAGPGAQSASGAPGGPSGGQGTGSGYRGSGPGAGESGSGHGGSGGGGRRRTGGPVPEPGEPGLDRRVQMVVRSYPTTRIEKNYDPIPYPGIVISRSNYQQGWCQVYLVIRVDDRGRVREVSVERPRGEAQAQFEALIRTVDEAVREWDYDKVDAEVHVDVRFHVE